MTYYLYDTRVVPDGVELVYFNTQTRDFTKIVDREYRPYFYVPYPLSPADQTIVEYLGATTRVQTKTELFPNKISKFVKVELAGSSDPRWASSRFEKAWEGEVPYVLSYAYDHRLIYGAPYELKGEARIPISDVADETNTRFEEEFSDVQESDPEKYKLMARWFTTCSQPVPEIPHKTQEGAGSITSEQYYLTFTLSRVANLPVPQARSNHQVSTWIKSILHNHLRRNNILIPTSNELRRGETKKSVQGALTFPPEPGVYFNTIVVDFESLYPSLIDVYNLSYETLDCCHAECRSSQVPGTAHHVCQLRRGVYSILFGALKDLRIRWYKPLAKDKTVPLNVRRLAQATSQLLKLLLVSAYGVTIRLHGLARPSLAESITAYGRSSLQTTWNLAQEAGLHPIYGDTDSLFLDDPREEQVDWLTRTVKHRLHLDLAVDERYTLCVLPRAMKAYFGIRKDGTPDIKGVTAIKSNSPTYIQKVFRDSVKELANVKNSTEYEAAKERVQQVVRDAIQNLKTGRIPVHDLEYPVEIHEDPGDKMSDKVLHQPYQCAIQLIDADQSVQKGDIVRFVKVHPFPYRGKTFTVKPTGHLKTFNEVNLDDYIRNLRTSLNQTFKPMSITFEEEDRTVTLADFV